MNELANISGKKKINGFLSFYKIGRKDGAGSRKATHPLQSLIFLLKSLWHHQL